jgi:hypothetical protein
MSPLTITAPDAQPEVSRFSIEGDVEVPRGGTVRFRAVARFEDGSTRDITSSVVWRRELTACRFRSSSPGLLQNTNTAAHPLAVQITALWSQAGPAASAARWVLLL